LGHSLNNANDEQRRQELLDAAVQLWEHAYYILVRFYTCSCHHYLRPTACLVSIAILHCLIPLRLANAKPNDSEGAVETSNGIKPRVGDLIASLEWCRSIILRQGMNVSLNAPASAA
jgi:hypothetical protein